MTARHETTTPHRGRLGLAFAASYAAAVLGLSAVFPEGPPREVSPLLNSMVGCVYVGLAGVVLWRRPGQRLGRVMLAMGLVLITGAATQVAFIQLDLDEHGPLNWIGVSIYLSLGLCFGLLMHLFPTGEPPSPAWRWPIRGLWLSTALIILGQMLGLSSDDNTLVAIVLAPVGLLYLVGILGAIPSLAVRFWRSRDAERAQVKWFLFAVVIATFGWLSSRTPGAILAAVLPPLAITVALTKYRLYDIDRLISRTASYTIVTGTLLITYGAIVTGATRVLPVSSDFAVASATLAAAALAQPLLRRVQVAVDRRFNRTRYDAQHTVDQFAARLRAEAGQSVLVDDLQHVVVRSFEPTAVRLWTREPA